jgi:aryl-alcohol dehydrogenase-like predicted oxidoreductase
VLADPAGCVDVVADVDEADEQAPSTRARTPTTPVMRIRCNAVPQTRGAERAQPIAAVCTARGATFLRRRRPTVDVMDYRLVGPSGLRVSEIVLGAMTFGHPGGLGPDAAESRRIFDAYTAAGGNAIDTAINYSAGHSEAIVGDLVAGDRERFVVATKYTVTRNPADPNGAGNHRKNLVHSLETSLRRMKTDYVDLYWVHIWDPNTPIDETMRALDDVVRSGKALYVGISDAPAWVIARGQTLAELRGWSPFVALQLPYSLVQREIERELLPVADAFGLSVVAWSPLAGGILSGKYGGAEQPTGTRHAGADISERDLRIAREVQAVASELGATPSQVAIAWTTARSEAILPIVGARNLDQFEDNLGALAVDLPAGALQRLDDVSAIALGFPHDFMAETAGWLYGEAGARVRPRPARDLRH